MSSISYFRSAESESEVKIDEQRLQDEKNGCPVFIPKCPTNCPDPWEITGLIK